MKHIYFTYINPALLCLCTLLLLVLGACDLGQASEVVGCSIEDEKLSVMFTEPKKAKRYLKDLGLGLKAKDPDSIKEAADLLARVAECL